MAAESQLIMSPEHITMQGGRPTLEKHYQTQRREIEFSASCGKEKKRKKKDVQDTQDCTLKMIYQH